RIWNVIRHQQLDFKGRAEVLERMIHVFESHGFLIEEEPVRYVFALGGYGMCLNVIGDYQKALDATVKLLHLKSDKDNVQRSVFLNFATNLSSYTLNTGDVAPFRTHLPYLLPALKQHAPSTPSPTLAYIHYLLAIVFWCADDTRLANRFAKRVVNAPAGRNNLQAACKCFLLIFAYEAEDPDLILRYARTWRRLWNQNAPRFEIERSFTNFMTRFLDMADRPTRRLALQSYLDELQAWLSGGFKVRADNFIFIVHWLRAKIEDRTLVEIVRAQTTPDAESA
ncbi:MAG: hypothetical protein AAF570_19700, partial [Bacteroidota bacterium]